MSRSSANQQAYAVGKTLLDFWEMSDLCILHGCAPSAPGETNGRMTRSTGQTSSVVAYFLTGAVLASTVHVMIMAVLDNCTTANHCPLTLEVMLRATTRGVSQIDDHFRSPSSVTMYKIKYDESRRGSHRETCPSCLTLSSLTLIRNAALPQLCSLALQLAADRVHSERFEACKRSQTP